MSLYISAEAYSSGMKPTHTKHFGSIRSHMNPKAMLQFCCFLFEIPAGAPIEITIVVVLLLLGLV